MLEDSPIYYKLNTVPTLLSCYSDGMSKHLILSILKSTKLLYKRNSITE